MHRQQAGHTGAALIFRAHGVARALGRDHHHVEIGARLDQVKVDVEPVRKHQRRALLHVLDEVVVIDVGLQFVGREHHHHVGPFRGLGDLHHLELLAFRLFDAAGALAQRDRNLLHAEIAQIERMGVALAAIADDGDLLSLDEIEIGVPVVINTHDT